MHLLKVSLVAVSSVSNVGWLLDYPVGCCVIADVCSTERTPLRASQFWFPAERIFEASGVNAVGIVVRPRSFAGLAFALLTTVGTAMHFLQPSFFATDEAVGVATVDWMSSPTYKPALAPPLLKAI